jgi:outer membrane protein assembly factor BamB
VLVPTISGDVEEIDLERGRRQGHYELGQPLFVSGVRQPGTSFVYFAADSYCVYVLDAARRECTAVLYTRHQQGALAGAPVVWNEAKPGAPTGKASAAGWLLLSELWGSGETSMRPFALPIANADQKPSSPLLKVRGRAHAGTWHDEEKLALATDAGVFSLFGIRQPGNRDPLLFPWLNQDYVLAGAESALPGPARIAHADENNWWVWAGGRLHRLQNTFTDAAGPGLTPRWRVPVGQPLHAVQAVRQGDRGDTLLILAGQDVAGPTCRVRAVEAETGKTRWQRQLGATWLGPALSQGDRLFLSAASGLFEFSTQAPADSGWHEAGKLIVPRGKTTASKMFVRGEQLVHLAWGDGAALRLHVISLSKEGGTKAGPMFDLPAPPQGTPALADDFLLVPLANGIIARVPLAETGVLVSGPDWRGLGVDEARPGHILALKDNDFIVTDGGRGFTRYRWGEEKLWTKAADKQHDHRIVSAPVAVDDDVAVAGIAVADAADNLVLLDQKELQEKRRWSVGGKISAGPFVRGPHICCVVEQKRLVAYHPNRDDPAWAYDFPAGIVGEPELAEGALIVSTLAGSVMALDPASGRPLAPGYTFRANAVAAAAPVLFGADRLFVPLTDGTAVLLSMKLLRGEAGER